MGSWERDFFQFFGFMIRLYIWFLGITLKGIAWSAQALWKGSRRLYEHLKDWQALRSEKVVGPKGKLPDRHHRDVWDYRGLETIGELFHLTYRPGASIKLGHATDATGRDGQKLGLPIDLLPQHILLIGPPKKGKTTRFIVPWIKELISIQSVFAIDAKGNLKREFGLDKYAELTGARFCNWNLSDPESQRWNFFEEISTDPVERHKDIAVVAKALLGERLPGEQGIFWERDLSWLEGILWLLVETEPLPKPSQILPTILDRTAAKVRLGFLKSETKRNCENLLSDYLRISDADFYKATFVLRNKLKFFDRPDISRICDGRSDFRLQDFNKPGVRMFALIGQPEAEEETGKQMAQLIAGIFNNLMLRRYAFGLSGEPVAFIADEAHALQQTVDFPKSAAILRAAGVGLCLSTQSISQFNTNEKPNQGSLIAGLCATTICLPGVDVETAEFLSKSFGDRVDPSTSVGRSIGSRSHGISGSDRTPILSVREIRDRHSKLEGTAIIQVRSGTSTRPFLTRY
ncbi:type IV secretory system conjugative DNA transfer family protein [Aerosakkonemataceae cyanobacterium BLCC-F50]|uniref:Type IV secretory system conjugative DNA transfer family protein n=1 Tax=Floridaenema flaviceps BLCC-F50 TaxID=3153642 RepID=A0ABV4XTY7_9CYAN